MAAISSCDFDGDFICTGESGGDLIVGGWEDGPGWCGADAELPGREDRLMCGIARVWGEEET